MLPLSHVCVQIPVRSLRLGRGSLVCSSWLWWRWDGWATTRSPRLCPWCWTRRRRRRSAGPPLHAPARLRVRASCRQSSCRRVICSSFGENWPSLFAVHCGTRLWAALAESLQHGSGWCVSPWSLEVTPSSQEGKRNPRFQILVLLRVMSMKRVCSVQENIEAFRVFGWHLSLALKHWEKGKKIRLGKSGSLSPTA